jgi:hypothetical protein
MAVMVNKGNSTLDGQKSENLMAFGDNAVMTLECSGRCRWEKNES